jgi:hypothetical protein
MLPVRRTGVLLQDQRCLLDDGRVLHNVTADNPEHGQNEHVVQCPTGVKKAAPALHEHTVRAVQHPAIAADSLCPSCGVSPAWMQPVSLGLLQVGVILLV